VSFRCRDLAILQTDFAAMAVSRPAPDAPPAMVSPPQGVVAGKRVLLVDETCDTGSTLRLALAEVQRLRPKEVRTAVSIVTGAYAPDFHALATEKLIVLPWDREIVVTAKLVRPDVAEYGGGEDRERNGDRKQGRPSANGERDGVTLVLSVPVSCFR
jgi:hypoxanthine phosphoribosyltransferase